ncbi:Spo0E family sporulation regulatory protein-aspartic acid phosphatase [Brevibacillus laterosporus]|uniref:Spo0E family sporulation regulatory protein-aspartic acid phosphatase n=1 Tax=Brevibacillus laterosporus TaxID=1465 RepID=UPI0035E407CB
MGTFCQEPSANKTSDKRCWQKNITQVCFTTRIQNMKTENSQLEHDLQKHFDLLRQGLEMLYYKEGSFLHPEVLQMTQQLDENIVAFQKNNN